MTVPGRHHRQSCDASGREDDAGLSLIELLVASAIGTMVISIVSIWLFTSQSTSNDFLDANSDESDVQLMLDTVVATITDARPTALCLDPHPTPSTTSGSDTRTLPETAVLTCNSVGENWGYTPLLGSVTGLQPGSPFREASSTGICYYALPDGTPPDPTAPVTPDGFCVDEDAGQLRIRTLESNASTYLGAAIAANWSWSSLGSGRPLGPIDNLEFKYLDLDGKEITAGSSCSVLGGSTCVAGTAIDSIELITITVERESGADAVSKKATAPVRVHRERLPGAPMYYNASTGSASGEIDVHWVAPLPNGSASVTNYHIQWITGSDTWDSPTGEDNTVSGTGISETITGLTSGTNYEVRMAAINSEGTGEWTAPISKTAG